MSIGAHAAGRGDLGDVAAVGEIALDGAAVQEAAQRIERGAPAGPGAAVGQRTGGIDRRRVDAGDVDGLAVRLEGGGVGRLGQEEAPPARLRAAAPAAARRAPAARSTLGPGVMPGGVTSRTARQDDDLGARPTQCQQARAASDKAEPPHWLAQMMRAIHSISRRAERAAGMGGLSEASSTARAVFFSEDLGHDLAVGGLDHDAVALAAGGVARHDQAIAVAIERHHGIRR